MKKYLITMGGSEVGWSRHNDEGIFRDYQKEAERLKESAKDFGLETIIYNNDFILNLPYYKEHENVLTRVSFGFAYKAICIYETMKNLQDGDILIWADSNHIIAQDPQPFIDIALEYGIFCHDHIWVYYPQRDWCRRDTFVNMGCDNEEFWDSVHLQDNVIILCKNIKTMAFATDWKDYCIDYKTMFGENKYENFPSFRQHRHNQAIFSLLVHKYRFPYLNRTQNILGENIIPEMKEIIATNPVDNRYRMEQDRKDNK